MVQLLEELSIEKGEILVDQQTITCPMSYMDVLGFFISSSACKDSFENGLRENAYCI